VSITAPVFGKMVGVKTFGQISSKQLVDPFAGQPAVKTTPLKKNLGK